MWGVADESSGPVLRVAAVQPAIPEAERHDPARFHSHLRELLALTDRALAEQPADLVAWPESAYERPAGASGDAFLGAIAHQLATPIVTGVWRTPDPGERAWRNGALLAAEDGTTWVAEKVHPVPVYERAPDGLLYRALARAGLGSGRFARGEPQEPVRLSPREGGDAVPIGVLVCIDASYPELARRLREAGARLLVVVANEAGTGPWSAALHARAARLRAIEGRVPVVRVANTGPTLWIDAYGRSVAQLPRAAAGSGSAALRLAGPVSPFVSLGDARARRQRRRDGPRRRRPRSRAAAAYRRASRSRTLSPERSLVMKSALAFSTCALFAFAAPSALAIDGGAAAPAVGASGGGSSYYEQAARQPEALAGAKARAAGLPAALHVVEAAGGVEYRSRGAGAWEVEVAVAERPHERLDAVYDLVLALPLPAGVSSESWRIGVREGSRHASAAAIYAGEKVTLKRNAPLESTWLPLLVGGRDGLPDLAGSGYEWTLWDTIVRYDPDAGPTLQGFATLRYTADPSLGAPDPEDSRSAAYVITWIPTLDATVPPFTLRLDVVAPGKE